MQSFLEGNSSKANLPVCCIDTVMQPCKLIMTTASNTANLQFLGITKASGHGHINFITLYFTVQILNLLVFIVGALVGKKTQLKFLQKFINCPKRWCIFFFRKGSIEFPKQMQIIIHVLFATHIKLEKWKKKKKDFLIFLVNVLLLDYLESICLAYMSQLSNYVFWQD